ncbi:MAG: ATPase, T2SS/T4P/T4SS family, partial [Candidatus Gracilibacteria bacterium]|nr:ATPase, T2SS/T4P/T4SS family [Candidatus Gracilibacteria bacterium]
MQIKDILKFIKPENTGGNLDTSAIFSENNSVNINTDFFDINSLFESAVKMGASDIHIEPDEDELKIRFRVDGKLNNYKNLPISNSAPILARIKVLGGLKIDEKRLPQDGKTNYKDPISGQDIDLRINIIPTIYGE